MLFLANFTPPPPLTLRHTSRDPPKVRHTSRTPRFLEGIVQNTQTKAPLYKCCLNCSRGFLSGVLSGGLLSGRFCPGWFLSVPVLSEYICYNRKLNITLNSMFRMYDKKCISVTSHALYPLSQTVTPSRTPSPFERYVLYGRPLVDCVVQTRIYLYFISIALRRSLKLPRRRSTLYRWFSRAFRWPSPHRCNSPAFRFSRAFC